MTSVFQDLKNGLKEVDAFLSGETEGYKVSVPTDVDVKAIRGRLHMTQSKFSDMFGFSLDAVKHWEGGRRTPEASARAFLTVISKNPAAVLSALHPTRKVAVAYKAAAVAKKKKASAAKRAVKKATREHGVHV
jgi:putative transcriptional regulator